MTAEDIALAAIDPGDGRRHVDLAVPDLRCGGCINTVESALVALEGVRQARANLTRRSVHVAWETGAPVPPLLETLAASGFRAWVREESAGERADESSLSSHLRALAVAGFAAGNVMMLSVSVWSGAGGEARALFHALSAAIALPALAYAGRVFFRSAWGAVRHGRVNMDVPISIGILLATALSMHDAFVGGEQVYFDAALMLVFFLLAGRTLEQRMRERARGAVDAIARLQPRGAHVLGADGTRDYRALAELAPGMRLAIDVGERLAVDARVESGRSTVDRAHVNGESLPFDVAPDSTLQAGTLNVGAPLVVIATSDARHSFLADIERLLQQAGAARGRHRLVADRAVRLYAPLVHVAAASSLLVWYLATRELHQAITIGVAVLIITCPCALGLAVPMVQSVAARRLFERGVLMKDGAALERLAEVDTVVFDKTGTLTDARAELIPDPAHDEATLALARALARNSSHPRSRALLATGGAASAALDAEPVEWPGLGIEGRLDGRLCRLGRADWALSGGVDPSVSASASVPAARTAATAMIPTAATTARNEASEPDPITATASDEANTNAGTVLSLDGRALATFRFRDRARADAQACIAALRRLRLNLEISSGDEPAAVAHLGGELGIARADARALPLDKATRVDELTRQGRSVLMVGDGINDSPAMATASVSMAPGTAADAGRRAADFVLLHDSLASIPLTVSIARRAHALVRQNLALALIYNVCAMPLAMAGLVTPLVAALSMSLSSVIVIANALRLGRVDAFERGVSSGP